MWFWNKIKYYICTAITKTVANMVVVAQSVRALDCGSKGRGFESHHPPKTQKVLSVDKTFFFCSPPIVKKHEETVELFFCILLRVFISSPVDQQMLISQLVDLDPKLQPFQP
jgi:hypothetical protein